MNAPTLQEWKDLYAAAVAFQEHKPWRWMDDRDFFAVRNPETGENGYCVVIGNAGQCFGLVVYRGEEGLAILIETYFDPDPNNRDISIRQNCLLGTFENRKNLDKEDLAVIRQLELQFRGQNAWPVFRSHLPHYFPWFLDAGEARFLTHAFKQALDISLRCKADPDIFVGPEDGLEDGSVLTRVPAETEQGLAWKDEWQPLKPPSPPKFPAPVIDLPRLEALKRRNIPLAGVWEVDVLPFYAPVKDEGRPYYPMMLLCADKKTDAPLPPVLGHPEEAPASIPDWMLDILDKSRAHPRKIFLFRPYLRPYIEAVTSSLGIQVELTDELPLLEKVLNVLLHQRY